jgi:exopolyphosphatase/pppGpp-phosphohydrolase
VMEAKAPTNAEAAKLSQFAQRVLKSAENYMKIEIDESFEPCDTRQGTILYGGVALKELLSKMKLKKTGQQPADLRTLRIFRWMLDGNEGKLYEEWTRDSVHRMKMMRAKALKDMEEEPDAKRPAIRAEVSAPPLMDKPASVRAASSKGPKAAAHTKENIEEELETASGLLSFFGAKAL